MSGALNVILALIWLAVGVVLLAAPQLLEGQDWARGVLDKRELLGGIAIVLAVYNLVRWNSLRAFRRDREAIQEAASTRRRLEAEHEREPHEPPNPAFNFDEPRPPQRPGEPPSPN